MYIHTYIYIYIYMSVQDSPCFFLVAVTQLHVCTCMYMYNVCCRHVHRHHSAHIGVFSGMYFSCGNTLLHMYSSSSSIRMCVLVYDSLSVMLREGE